MDLNFPLLNMFDPQTIQEGRACATVGVASLESNNMKNV